MMNTQALSQPQWFCIRQAEKINLGLVASFAKQRTKGFERRSGRNKQKQRKGAGDKDQRGVDWAETRTMMNNCVECICLFV